MRARGEGQIQGLWKRSGVDCGEGQVGLWSTWIEFGKGQVGVTLVFITIGFGHSEA